MRNLTGIIPEEHQALQVVAPSPDVMGNYAGGLINQVKFKVHMLPLGSLVHICDG